MSQKEEIKQINKQIKQQLKRLDLLDPVSNYFETDIDYI